MTKFLFSNCSVCNLKSGCRSPIMPPSGRGEIPILFIGEAPGKNEDEQGSQFVGYSGQFLRKVLNNVGINLEDCRKTNAVRCYSESTPTEEHIEICRTHIREEVDKYHPKVIFALGKSALISLFGDRNLPSVCNDISATRGWVIPDLYWNAWICPTFHPSFVLRSLEKDPVVSTLFTGDITRGLNYIEEPLRTLDFSTDKIQILQRNEHLSNYIDSLPKEKPVSIDYETTTLSPHHIDSQILTIAIACDDKVASSTFPSDPNIIMRIKKLIAGKEREKVAHNIQFEFSWTQMKLGLKDQHWTWDTMLVAHMINNSSGLCGLEVQAFLNFGIESWENEVKPYKSFTGSSCVNRLNNCPLEKLLLYNAKDALITLKLFELQRNLLG